MNKEGLISLFKKNIYNGFGVALYSNCGWGYVYECFTKDITIRVCLNQVLAKKNDSDFLFFNDKYELTTDEFKALSENLPKRLLKIKTLANNDTCTVRNNGSVDIKK